MTIPYYQSLQASRNFCYSQLYINDYSTSSITKDDLTGYKIPFKESSVFLIDRDSNISNGSLVIITDKSSELL